eukprot:TRINITY_DN30258_c0_g1_i2.p1 TRINITY_DN30258_c0_g1~~TRINITY_DN30258_c0_g1_i2.p1  ORF type:complete len:294 (-),score=34.60 TRINITY_DN30258_c0_g1_i2:205-1086(-)
MAMASSSQAAGAACIPAYMEIQREIDAMQTVYTHERRQLEALMQEMDEEIQHLRHCLEMQAEGANTESQGGQQAPPSPRSPFGVPRGGGLSVSYGADVSTPRSIVKWRLDDSVEGEAIDWDSFLSTCQSSSSRWGRRRAFYLVICPGVLFELCISVGDSAKVKQQSGEPCGADAAGGGTGLELRLQTSGALCEGLCLRTTLRVAVEDSEGSELDSETAAGEISGAGNFLCRGPRLSPLLDMLHDSRSASLLCTAEISLVSWQAAAITFTSQWPGSNPVSPCDEEEARLERLLF